jgi:hypothetical protein
MDKIVITPTEVINRQLSDVSLKILDIVSNECFARRSNRFQSSHFFYELEYKYSLDKIEYALQYELKIYKDQNDFFHFDKKEIEILDEVQFLNDNTYAIYRLETALQIFMFECVNKVYGIKKLRIKTLTDIINRWFAKKNTSFIASEQDVMTMLRQYKYNQTFYTGRVNISLNPVILEDFYKSL